MTIRELRILPPFAIGRLGSAPAPLDNFTMVESQEHPLDYRALVPQETLTVNERTGEISGSHTPDAIAFKDDAGRIRPVAPFLEVFARVDRSRAWQPLTLSLLSKHGYRVIAQNSRDASDQRPCVAVACAPRVREKRRGCRSRVAAP